MTEQKLELADIFRSLDPSFVDSLPAAQRRVVQDMVDCRTAALGGHIERCDQCGHQQIAYNSCLMGSYF
jgi:Transposase zinc-binding domain